MTTVLHLLIIRTPHAETPTLHLTRQAAEDAAYDYVAEFWDQDGPGYDDGVAIPEDRDAAIKAYFLASDESYWITEVATPEAPATQPAGLPPIVYDDEAVASWHTHLQAIEGWNVQLTLNDGSRHDAAIRGAGFDGDSVSGLQVAYFVDGREPDENTDTEWLPIDRVVKIRVY